MRVVVEVTFIVLGTAAAALCLAVLAARLPTGQGDFEERLGPPAETELWPAQFVRLERVIGWSASSDLDAHTRLRPVLVEVVQARLARRGLSLERDPAEARRLLGTSAWELVRPERPEPRRRDAPGIDPRALDEILTRLEAV